MGAGGQILVEGQGVMVGIDGQKFVQSIGCQEGK